MTKKYFWPLHLTLSVVIILSFSPFTIAQSFSYSTPSPYNIQLNSVLTNPGIKQENRALVLTNFHSYLGAFSDVNYINLVGIVNIHRNHAIGSSVLHESTSGFFTRTRFYAIYQSHVLLSETTWLTMGAKIGVINFNMKALGGSNGGSDWAPDLSLGVSIKNTKYLIGGSIEQITKPSLQPIQYIFQIERIAELHGSYSFEISSDVTYSPEIRYRHEKSLGQLRCNNNFEFYNIVGITANYFLDIGYTVGAFYNVKTKNANYQFYASYFYPAGSYKNIDARQLELGLSLSLLGNQ